MPRNVHVHHHISHLLKEMKFSHECQTSYPFHKIIFPAGKVDVLFTLSRSVLVRKVMKLNYLERQVVNIKAYMKLGGFIEGIHLESIK